MAVKRKKTGAGISVPAGIAIGAAAAVAVMLLGTLLVAYLVIQDTVKMDAAGFAALCVLAAAAALGCWLATALTGKNKLLVCVLTALAFILVLLSVTAIFFDGTFSGVGGSALAILAGAGVTLLPEIGKKSRKNRIKIPAYR